MFGFGKLRFKTVDRSYISDQQHVDDYKSAEKIGRVRVGKLCLYYQDLGKKYCVPYEYIDRSFTRISECQGNDFMEDVCYYRLVLVHSGKEFANLIFEKEEDVDRIHGLLQQIRPEIEQGYIPPVQ